MGFQPNYQSEGRIYAKYILDKHPAGKIAVLFQNDDYGKDVLKGVRDGLGDKNAMIVAEMPYEPADPTVDSQIVRLKASGADIFINITTPKFAAQAIKKVAELGWKPLHILNNVSASIGSVLRPAGFENARGIITTTYLKDPTDPALAKDPGLMAWTAFMDKYYPEGDKTNSSNVSAHATAALLVQVLKQCGDNLTRENVMRQAANLKDVELEMLMPGIKVNTSPKDYFPLEELQMRRFSGERWESFGPIMSGEIGS
jgi:branched-chain amino acid transport system substrate-binding protein